LNRKTIAPTESPKTNANTKLTQGQGRIFRIVPTNFKQPTLPQLGKVKTSELVTALMYANGWHRDTGDYVATVEALLSAGAKAPEVTDDLEASEPVRDLLRQHAEGL